VGAPRRGAARALAGLVAGVAVLVGLPPPASAELSLDALFRLESDTAWRVADPQEIQKSQNRLEVDAELGLARSLRLRFLGRLLYDPVEKLVGPDPDFGQDPVDRWQVGGADSLEAELRELHLGARFRLGPARFDLRLGKQQVVWGQSFGLRVLDIVNPQTFREFILDDFVDARTTLWGARVDAFAKGWSLQALFFPDFEPDVLPDPESEFALNPELPGLLPALASAPGRPPVVALLDPDRPDDDDPGSWGFGFRAGTTVRDVDVALHYWDRKDPRGVFRRAVVRLPGDGDVPLNVLQRDFVRVRTVGFSFSTVRGDFALWGEGGVSFDRGFVTDDLSDADGVVRGHDLEYALGLDWNGWEHLFLNLQWIQLVVFDHHSSIDLDPVRSFASLLLRFDLLEGELFPQLFALWGTNENDLMLRPSVEWRATDRLSVTLGADVFHGPAEGLLGQLDAGRGCTPRPFTPAGSPFASCGFDPPPGRPSRVFLRFEYRFALPR